MGFVRPDGRSPVELRTTRLQRGVAKFAEGSCLIEVGDTKVLVTATVEDKVPGWMRNQGSGWITAEYGMLPRSGKTRNQRDSLRPNGRTMEIQRLIGRSIRSIVDLNRFGERTITIDCDALQADGGTRTASITAAYVAIVDAFRWMVNQRMIDQIPISEQIAAVSVGIVGGTELLDLCYEEDFRAAVDMNLVMTDQGRYVEVQGTAESEPFSEESLAKLIGIGKIGLKKLFDLQKEVLEQ